MKELNLFQMEEITGGGQQRTCMIIGGIATLSFIAGFLYQPFWVLAAGSIITGAVYGCFD